MAWNTLYIQMPVLSKESKFYDYVPTFPEAWSYALCAPG